jgi:Uma2 family endonuclease
MASRVLITPEQYLATHFEREPELVRGELVEKSLPNLSHGKTQQRLCVLLSGAGCGCTEVRMKLAEDLFRIPDFALFERDPEEELPRSPPLLAVEIASPDDRVLDVEQKLEEYRLGRSSCLVRRAGVAETLYLRPWAHQRRAA